ncbi:hydroxyacylglutathione hydrolase [Thiosulfatimonas sediminis]|uniref:Hydroxyacylglutathione hydrolase n=1 Tax=Thiosulfatimonas sediminis TaxID=2675054 RepID=A0A6F8PUH3_9GAMM|nr:hydroxyacylglutathione hydrolase [Thiosulfatimonas sediminis]
MVGTYDNYIWVMYDSTQGLAWIVDPGEARQVIDFLQQNQLQAAAILITHRHFDHIDGVAEIKANYPDCVIYGPQKTPFTLIEKRLSEGEQITLNPDLHFRVLDTPGHTEDHISYVNEKWLFCADTLFTGGCGRILGGTVEQFANSILKLRALNEDLLFYCAHEYSADNLAFATYVEPENTALQQRLNQLHVNYPALHDGNVDTLGLEKRTNPFMRFDTPALKAKLIAKGSKDCPAELFATLRAWKDRVDQGIEKITVDEKQS